MIMTAPQPTNGLIKFKKEHKMKHIKSSLFILIAISITTHTAFAAKQCIQLDLGIDGIDVAGDDYSNYWEVDLTPPVCSGVAVCGSPQAKYSIITNPSSSTGSTGCWCRMLEPAVSSVWVASTTYASPALCSQNCAYSCMSNFTYDETFRSIMFGHLR